MSVMPLDWQQREREKSSHNLDLSLWKDLSLQTILDSLNKSLSSVAKKENRLATIYTDLGGFYVSGPTWT